MGGVGSGRWYRSGTRYVAEELLRFTPQRLARAVRRVAVEGYERELVRLSWERAGRSVGSIIVLVERRASGLVARLCYTVTEPSGEAVEYDYAVPLVSTPSNLPGNAGRRWWFICPLAIGPRVCGRRVGVLYSVGGLFGCRHCHRITYTSCNESHQAERLARYLAGVMGGDATPERIAETLRAFDRAARRQ